MARTRGFDEQAVLERAMRTFWAKGYKATSLEQLLAATRLSKSSLYGAFGSKRKLLLAALRNYSGWLMQGPAAPLQHAGAGRAAIEATLCAVIDHAVSPPGQRGCFANNCMAEVAPHDAQVMQATRAVVRRLEEALLRAVEQGQRDGTIAAGEEPRALARFLVNTLSGINLAAKARPDRARLDDIARVALRALD